FAVILSFVVLYAIQALFPAPKPQPARPVPGAQAPAAASATPPSATPPTPVSPAERPAQPVAPQPSAAPLVADTAERDVAVENQAVRAVFTTRGAALTSWRLKKYQDTAREPLELVPHSVPPDTPRPFTLQVPEASTTATLARALFKPSADNVQVTS